MAVLAVKAEEGENVHAGLTHTLSHQETRWPTQLAEYTLRRSPAQSTMIPTTVKRNHHLFNLTVQRYRVDHRTEKPVTSQWVSKSLDGIGLNFI